MKPCRRRAFTLIELLVVISIIALLISILLPALEAAKESARVIVCASKQKHLGLALHLYAGDFDQTFPISTFGLAGQSLAGNAHQRVFIRDSLVHEYVRNVDGYECPSDRGPRPDYWQYQRYQGKNFYEVTGTSYSYNAGSWHIQTTRPYPMPGPPVLEIPLDLHSWGVWGRHIDNFESPSKQVMVAEWSFYWLVSQEWPGEQCCSWGDARYFVLHGVLGRTPAQDAVRMNMVFVDGHGEFLKLHHRGSNLEHYINDDYEYTSPPLR